MKKAEPTSDLETTPKSSKAKAKKEESTSSPKKRAKKEKSQEEQEEEDMYRWWEQQDPDGDGSIKWQTLEHNGVYFPPPYVPLPSDVKMKYNGESTCCRVESFNLNIFQANLLIFLPNLRR